jgi:hypothetical protein
LSFPVPFVPFQIQPFVNLKFHVLAPVGGIAIIQYFGLQIHPVRVQIEHKTGKAIMAYFFQENDAVHAPLASRLYRTRAPRTPYGRLPLPNGRRRRRT